MRYTQVGGLAMEASCSNSDTCVNELFQTLLREDNFEIRKLMKGLNASVQNVGKSC